MRPDQLQRLQELSERLADVFLVEADPDNWSGGDTLPKDMSKQQRGDRHWDRKGAIGTGAVLSHTLNVIKAHTTSGEGDQKPDDDLEQTIKDAEKKAAKAMERVVNKARGKVEFDRRAHGK